MQLNISLHIDPAKTTSDKEMFGAALGIVTPILIPVGDELLPFLTTEIQRPGGIPYILIRLDNTAINPQKLDAKQTLWIIDKEHNIYQVTSYPIYDEWKRAKFPKIGGVIYKVFSHATITTRMAEIIKEIATDYADHLEDEKPKKK